jgi:hypothetical protein
MYRGSRIERSSHHCDCLRRRARWHQGQDLPGGGQARLPPMQTQRTPRDRGTRVDGSRVPARRAPAVTRGRWARVEGGHLGSSTRGVGVTGAWARGLVPRDGRWLSQENGGAGANLLVVSIHRGSIFVGSSPIMIAGRTVGRTYRLHARRSAGDADGGDCKSVSSPRVLRISAQTSRTTRANAAQRARRQVGQ